MGYLDDNDPGTTSEGDPTLGQQQPGWLDGIKKYVGGLLPQDKAPAPPPVDMGRWGPVLESAGLGPDSPEHKLLSAISGHVNSAPIPKEDSMGSKALGVLGNSISAGFLRRAGASAAETQAPMNAMVADWKNRRDAGDAGRMKAWEAGGSLVIPQVSSAIQQAENKRILREQAAANRGRIFGEDAPTPAGAPAASPGAPPAGGGPSPATTPAGQPAGLQAAISAAQGVLAEKDPTLAKSNWQEILRGPSGSAISDALEKSGTRTTDAKTAAQAFLDAAKNGGAPPASASAATPAPQPGTRSAIPLSPSNMPAAEPDRPMYQLGKGPHYFYTEQWRNAADSILRGNIDNNALVGMGIKVDPAKSKEAQAEDALMQLKSKDEAAHQASPGYKGHVKAAETYAEKRVQGGMDMKAKLDTGAEAGRNANRTLDLMRTAFEETQKQGVLGPGFATSWLTNINNALDRVGLPHMETAPIQMINELSNRMGIESMMEEMSAGNGMKGGGQRMFMAFREAVANTSQNPAGFAAIMEAMQALNNTQVVGQDAANEWLSALEKNHQVPVLDHNAQQYINTKKQEAFQQAQAAVNRVIQGGQAKSGQQAGGAPAMGREDAKKAARELIAKDPTLSADAAMKQVLGGAAAGAPGATNAAPGATAAPPAATSDVPPRPEPGFKRKVWDWSYPDEAKRKQQEEELQRLRTMGRVRGPV